MGAAVHDIHARHRQCRLCAGELTEVFPQRQSLRLRRTAGNRHRDGENRIRAEFTLVFRAVGGDHRGIDISLFQCVHAGDLRRNLVVDGGNRFCNALAAETLLVAVTKLNSLMNAGGRPRRTCRSSERSR